MAQKMKLLALILLALVAAVLPAQSPAPAAENLVVLHTLGPNWAKRAEFSDALRAHQRMYQDLARAGDILFGGRLQGEPVLGISVFRSNIDRAEIAERLRRDPSVVAGVIALEFRVWEMQLGTMPDSTRRRAPGP